MLETFNLFNLYGYFQDLFYGNVPVYDGDLFISLLSFCLFGFVFYCVLNVLREVISFFVG